MTSMLKFAFLWLFQDDPDLHKITLDDVFVEFEDNIIELKELKFAYAEKIFFSTFRTKLGKLSIDVIMNMGNIKVEGKFETNNQALHKILPASNVGDIEFHLEDIVAKGKIGMRYKRNVVEPINYDLVHLPRNIELRVKSVDLGGNVIENRISCTSVECSLVKTFWVQMTRKLTQLLHKELKDVLNSSLNMYELLYRDYDEYVEVIDKQSKQINRQVDDLLASANQYMVTNESVETPPFKVIYKNESGEYGFFQTGLGCIRDLTSIARKKNFNVYEEGHNFVVYGSLKLRQFQHVYDNCTAGIGNLKELEGPIKVTFVDSTIFIKIILPKDSKEGHLSRVDTVQLQDLGILSFDLPQKVSGVLGERTKSWVIGNLRSRAIPVLEKWICDALTSVLN